MYSITFGKSKKKKPLQTKSTAHMFLTAFGPFLFVCQAGFQYRSGLGESVGGRDECECVSTLTRRVSGCRLEKQGWDLPGFDAMGSNMKTQGVWGLPGPQLQVGGHLSLFLCA